MNHLVKKRLTRRHISCLWLAHTLIWLSTTACDSSRLIHPTVEGPLSLGEELRLGILVSGDYWRNADRANQMINAVYLLRDRVNACGGINQAPMSVVIKEADGTSQSETTAMQDLIDEHRVHGVVAQFSSQDSSSTLELAQQAETPLLIASLDRMHSSINLEPEMHDVGYTVPSIQQQIQALVQIIRKQGHSTLALIRSDSSSIRIWEEIFIPIYESNGGEVVNVDQPLIWNMPVRDPSLDNDQTLSSERDVNEQVLELQELLDRDPEAIVVALDTADGYDFLTTITTLGWRNEQAPIFWHSQETLDEILEQMQPEGSSSPQVLEALDGISGIVPAFSGQGFQGFSETWQANLDEAPIGNAASAWDAVSIFSLAAQAAGQNSRTGILSEMRSISNPPGMTITDICQGLEQLRSQESINFEGASSSLDMNRFREIPGVFNAWRIDPEGKMTITEQVTLDAD